jgi:hypothetical protein
MVNSRTRPTEPDLFTSASFREPLLAAIDLPRSTPSITEAAPATSSPRCLLPKDLPNGIKQLTDQEFDRLLAAVLAEQKRRGRELPVPRETSHKLPIKETGPLTPAKLNAVRATFKAGVSPSRIARQFGISQSDVRKALASDKSKRAPSRD